MTCEDEGEPGEESAVLRRARIFEGDDAGVWWGEIMPVKALAPAFVSCSVGTSSQRRFPNRSMAAARDGFRSDERRAVSRAWTVRGGEEDLSDSFFRLGREELTFTTRYPPSPFLPQGHLSCLLGSTKVAEIFEVFQFAPNVRLARLVNQRYQVLV